ncbi:hypothetical protein [Frankia sp. EI5c]|uniref:hypothetical protein n=1 Tax=Frankia sp. EI5c TaxID=683316 RepID=UPI0008247A1F|nr:hypothetical protein [Frankia sp. EI5c]
MGTAPVVAGNAAPAVLRLLRQVRAGGAGSRFGGVLAVLLGVLALAGVVSHEVLDQRLVATDNIRERSAAALIAAERLRAGLAGADATAAAGVFAWVALAPGDSTDPARRRAYYDRIKGDSHYAGDHSGDGAGTRSGKADDPSSVAGPGRAVNEYSSALRGAVTALLALREIDPGGCDPVRDPQSTHCAMDRIATLIPEYVGLVAEATANTRAGNTVGGSYQTLASTLMATSILGQTDLLVSAYGERVDQDYRRATSGAAEELLLGAFGCALTGLFWTQFYVFRRTRRILNVGLAAATVLVVGVGAAGLVLLNGQQSRLAATQRADYRPMTLLAASRTLAFQARTCEFLSLMSLGNGEEADHCFASAVSALGYTPEGRPGAPSEARRRDGLLTAALAALPSESAARGGELAADLGGWLRTRAGAVATLHQPPTRSGDAPPVNVFERAVEETLNSSDFDNFVGGTDELLARGVDSFDDELRGAAAAVRLLSGLVTVLVSIAVLGAVLGVGARIREYL